MSTGAPVQLTRAAPRRRGLIDGFVTARLEIAEAERAAEDLGAVARRVGAALARSDVGSGALEAMNKFREEAGPRQAERRAAVPAIEARIAAAKAEIETLQVGATALQLCSERGPPAPALLAIAAAPPPRRGGVARMQR